MGYRHTVNKSEQLKNFTSILIEKRWLFYIISVLPYLYLNNKSNLKLNLPNFQKVFLVWDAFTTQRTEKVMRALAPLTKAEASVKKTWLQCMT